MKHNKLYLGLAVGMFATGLLVNQAEAVPSFARQTGMACAACHTVFPELNSFGRTFKLNGYTLTGITQVEAKESKSASGLQFNQIPPLSAMLQVSYLYSKNQDPTSQVLFPDQLSFFFAGEISPNLGSFIQITMEQGEGFAMDNADIRYANHAGSVTYGVTVNNSPTVQDLWNSTPVWGYPFTHGADMPSPVISDALAQNVAGLGGYADWGNGIYTELSFYSSTNPMDAPSGAPVSVRLHGAAPYARLAWGKQLNSNNYLMIGVYGMQSVMVQDGDSGGPQDTYNDAAIDAQYEYTLANSDLISFHARYTNEDQTLDLSDPGNSPYLRSTRVDGTYHWGYHATATLAYATNSSDVSDNEATAWTGQFSYLPWQNTKFTLQYVAYTKYEGTTDNASDNNTLLAQAWLMW